MIERTGGANAPARWDVVVVGGGCAGLTAAIAAAHRGRSVLVLDAGSFDRPGGNTRHARSIWLPAVPGRTPTPDERASFRAGLTALGAPETRGRLLDATTDGAGELAAFMTAHGAVFSAPYEGVVHPEPDDAFLVGGGMALVRAYRRVASRLGVTFATDAVVTGFTLDDAGTTVRSVDVVVAGRSESVPARAVIVASGSADTNGIDAASTAVLRGGAANTGAALGSLEALGATVIGEGSNLVAVDDRAPQSDGGIAIGIDVVPFGIVVDSAGHRFVDEGASRWSRNAMLVGAAVAARPDGRAVVIWDSAVGTAVIPTCWPPERATTIGELAHRLGVDADGLEATVARFNDGTSGAAVDHTVLDGVATNGVVPTKSNWASPIVAPPFSGVWVRPGVMGSYRGCVVDSEARILRDSGVPFTNLFAAGEAMAASIRPTVGRSGLALLIAGVWGRIAARSAADVA